MEVLKEINEHMATVEVGVRRVVHMEPEVVVRTEIEVAVHTEMKEVVHMALAVDHIDLVAVVVVHRAAEFGAGHIEVVADLGRTIEDMVKTSGLEVEVEAVCYIPFALEDMVKMAGTVAGYQAGDKVTVVVLENRGEEASAVRVAGRDMDW